MPNPTKVTMSVCSAFGQMPDQNWTSVTAASLGLGRMNAGMLKIQQIASHTAKNVSTETIGVSFLAVEARIGFQFWVPAA
jgi:hypothetical protein